MRHRIIRDNVSTIAPVRVVVSAATGPRGIPGDGSGGPTGPVVESLEGQTGVLTLGDIGAVASSDPRLSDARTPTVHTHTPADIIGGAGIAASWHAAVGEWWLITSTFGGVGYTTANISSSAALSEKKVAFTPLILTTGRSVDAAALHVAAASNGVGAQMGIGIWTLGSDGRPAVLAKDFGTAGITTAGVKTITSTSTTLAAGHYFVGVYVANLVAGGGTVNPSFAVVASSGPALSEPNPAGSSSMLPSLLMTADAWPPTSLTTPTIVRYSTGRGYHVWLRRSS